MIDENIIPLIQSVAIDIDKSYCPNVKTDTAHKCLAENVLLLSQWSIRDYLEPIWP